MAKALAIAAAAAALVSPSTAYVYSTALHTDFVNQTFLPAGSNAIRLSEGPMYASGELASGDSTITVSVAASATSGATASSSPLDLVARVVIVGPNVDVTKVVACCTAALVAQGTCSHVGAFELPPGMTDTVEFNATLSPGQVRAARARHRRTQRVMSRGRAERQMCRVAAWLRTCVRRPAPCVRIALRAVRTA